MPFHPNGDQCQMEFSLNICSTLQGNLTHDFRKKEVQDVISNHNVFEEQGKGIIEAIPACCIGNLQTRAFYIIDSFCNYLVDQPYTTMLNISPLNAYNQWFE